jgi:hypothetical protein
MYAIARAQRSTFDPAEPSGQIRCRRPKYEWHVDAARHG